MNVLSYPLCLIHKIKVPLGIASRHAKLFLIHMDPLAAMVDMQSFPLTALSGQCATVPKNKLLLSLSKKHIRLGSGGKKTGEKDSVKWEVNSGCLGAV